MADTESSPVRRSRRRTALLVVASCILIGIATLVIVEGLSSSVLLGYDLLARSHRTAVRGHTMYDPDLGWVNRPGLALTDFYGEGRDLLTNSQGFRNSDEIARQVPEGRVRIVCSGDSFTLGHGVGNDDTWCHRLSVLEPTLETVNMGQGGYGADQAYLWYLRDGRRIEHDIQLFALITADIHRMQSDRFLGYPKPILRLRGDSLTVDNVPVPVSAYRMPWVSEAAASLRGLRTFELIARAIGNGGGPPPRMPPDTATRRVVGAMLAGLAAAHESRGSTLIVVYLPTMLDAEAPDDEPWRDVVRVESERRGIAFIDLAAGFRDMPYGQLTGMFIADGEAAGHYSESGNAYIASVLASHLLSLGVLAHVAPDA